MHIYDPDEKTVGNYAMPLQGQEITALVARRGGVFRFGCDAGHGWMSAYVRVLEHPFFSVTAEDGSFRITGLPKGKYKLIAWHPDVGEVEQVVELKGRASTASVTLRL